MTDQLVKDNERIDDLQNGYYVLSTALAAGQGTQQQTMEQRLQGLEASNARKLEEMRRTLAAVSYTHLDVYKRQS